jgi:hypothetical protein
VNSRSARATFVLIAAAVGTLAPTHATRAQSVAAPIAPALTDPDQIFRAARKAWSFTAYPRYSTYTIVVTFRNGRSNVTRHYDAIEDMRRDIVFAKTFSHEEIANPSIPHGFNVRLGSINGQGGALANGEGNPDRIGPLALGINYDFGISLLPQKTNVVSSTRDIQFPPNLPLIGSTGSTTHDYTVRLIGMLDGGKIYHLGLEPTHDAGRLRLREMWVSAGSFLTRRILVSANFDKDPYDTVPWLIEFNHLGAEAPLDFEDNLSLPNVIIAFEDVKLLPELPQYGAVGANDSSDALAEP